MAFGVPGDPAMSVAARLPKVEDDVICLSCRHVWICVRSIGLDLSRVMCPVCEERKVEFEEDAPRHLARIH